MYSSSVSPTMSTAGPHPYDMMDINSLTALANSKLEGVKTVYEAYEERLEEDEPALRQWRDSMAAALDKYYAVQPSVVGKKAGVKRILLEMAKNAKDLFNDVDASLDRKRLERERYEEDRKYEELRVAQERRREEDQIRRTIEASEQERNQRLSDILNPAPGESGGNGPEDVNSLPPSSRRRARKRHHSEISEDLWSTTPLPHANNNGSTSLLQPPGVTSYEAEVLALLPEDHRMKVITEGDKIGRWAIPNYVPEGDELSNPNSPLYKCDHKGKTHDGAKGRKEKWNGDQRCTQCRVHHVSPCLSTGCHACASCTQKKQGPCSHTYGARKSLETQLADRRAKEEKERAKAGVNKSVPDIVVEVPNRNQRSLPPPTTNGRPANHVDSDEEEIKSVVELDADMTKSIPASSSQPKVSCEQPLNSEARLTMCHKRPRATGRIERLEDELEDVNRRISQAEESQQQAFERIHSATLDAQRATTAMQLGYRDKQRIEHDLERERDRVVREIV